MTFHASPNRMSLGLITSLNEPFARPHCDFHLLEVSMQFLTGTMGRQVQNPKHPRASLTGVFLSQRILHIYVWSECLSGAQQSYDRTVMRPWVDDDAIDAEMGQIGSVLDCIPPIRPAAGEDDDSFLSRVIDVGWAALKSAGCDWYRRV